MKKEKSTIRFSWLTYPMLTFMLGAALSCAGMIPEYRLKGAEPAPSEEEIPEVLADRIQQAYTTFTMASIHMAHGRYEEAKSYLLAALDYDPDSVYLHQKMAALLKEMKDYKTATMYAQKSLDLDPTNVRNRILLAEIYAASGDRESAIREYKEILELDPDRQRIRLILTSILIRKGQFKPALAHLDKLIQQDPNMVMAHYYRGRINLELKNHSEAENAYLDALKINRRMEPALFDLGSLYQMLQNYAKAGEIYEPRPGKLKRLR